MRIVGVGGGLHLKKDQSIFLTKFLEKVIFMNYVLYIMARLVYLKSY
jgi:hypothetical protein